MANAVSCSAVNASIKAIKPQMDTKCAGVPVLGPIAVQAPLHVLFCVVHLRRSELANLQFSELTSVQPNTS